MILEKNPLIVEGGFHETVKIRGENDSYESLCVDVVLSNSRVSDSPVAASAVIFPAVIQLHLRRGSKAKFVPSPVRTTQAPLPATICQ